MDEPMFARPRAENKTLHSIYCCPKSVTRKEGFPNNRCDRFTHHDGGALSTAKGGGAGVALVPLLPQERELNKM